MAQQTPMIRATRILLSLIVVFVLSSCQLMTLFNAEDAQNPGGSSLSLADSIINDYVSKIQGSTFSRTLDANNRLSATDIEQLKSIIRKKVRDDGLESSSHLDDVLPSVMAGIAAGVKNLGDVEGDTSVSAQLLTKAIQSTSESMSKHAAKASSNAALPALLQKVVKKGAEELAVISKKDPDSAGAALKTIVSEVAEALKTNEAILSQESVLKAVVTGSVQAAIQAEATTMVSKLFEGAAEATTFATVIQEVVKDAVLNAVSGEDSSKLLDATTATEVLKQVAAGLGETATDTIISDVKKELAETAAVTIEDTVVEEIQTVREEVAPEASLEAVIDTVAYTEGTELDYSDSRSVVFTTGAASGTEEELIGPDGNDVTIAEGKASYTLTGAGAFRFILLVKNTGGVKSAYKTFLIRVKPRPAEVAPVAALTIKEGTTAVTSALTWTKDGHTLTFDTAGSTTSGTEFLVQSDSADAVPTKSDGVWSVLQKYGTVNYTLIVKNKGGLKSTKVTKSVTVSPEPAVTAVLKAYNGETEITGTLPRKATYDVTLKSEGTSQNTVQSLTVSPAATLVEESDGVWTATLLAGVGTYTFTFTAQTDGGKNKTVVTKVIAIAAETAPVAALAIKRNGGNVTTALPFANDGYELTLDPSGSTTANTELSIVDNGKNTVIAKNENGTWTAKGVQQTTTFTLTVKNLGGTLSSTASKTVTINPPGTTDVSADVQTGIEAVKQHQWSAAKTAFAAAILKDPNDTDAKIWSSLLDLVTLSVHPQLVDLLRNRVGVADYPNSMEQLLSKEWLKATARNSQSGLKLVTSFSPDGYYFIRGNIVSTTGTWANYNYYYSYPGSGNQAISKSPNGEEKFKFVPSATGDVVVRYWSQPDGTTLNADQDVDETTVAQNVVYSRYYYYLSNQDLSPIPLLSPVEGFERLDHNLDGSAVGNGYGATDYMRLLAANVFSRNPLGFNSFVDQVANGPLGASLDSIVARLNSLGDGERTVVPVDLIDQATRQFGMNSASLPTVTIGKPELLLLAANLKVIKTFVLYLCSVNFDYPVPQALVEGMAKVSHPDANGDGQDDYTEALIAATPGFYFSNVLRDRDLTARAASKATFLSALDNVLSALNLYKTLVADETSGYRTDLGPMIVAMAGSSSAMVPTHEQVINTLDNFVVQVTKVRNAVSENGDLTVNSNVVSSGPYDPFAALLSHFPSDGAWVTRPGEVWQNNVFDPRFWFEGNSTDGLTLHFKSEYYGTETKISKPVPSDLSTLTAGFLGLTSTATSGTTARYQWMGLVMKLKKTSLQKFYPAGNPTDEQLAVPFGPRWLIVDYDYAWDSTTATYVYTYHYALQPPQSVKDYLLWINKK